MPEQALFRRKEAAAFLGVSLRKLDQWIARGDLTAIRKDGLVRIRREDLEAFAASWEVA